MLSSMRWVFDLRVLILLSACGAGCSHTALTIKADQNYNGRTINLRVGDGVKVTLAENPTTGYKWEFLAKPEPICVTVGEAYVANPAMGTIGGGGGQGVGLVVADDFFCRRVEYERAAEAIRSVGEVHERRGDVSLLNRRIDF